MNGATFVYNASINAQQRFQVNGTQKLYKNDSGLTIVDNVTTTPLYSLHIAGYQITY